MILDFRVSNYMVFSDEQEFSFRADSEIERFGWNLRRERDFDDVLKSACLYGANNSGKTCLVEAMKSMIEVLRNASGDEHGLEERINMFSDDRTCGLGVSFLWDGKAYSYDLRYVDDRQSTKRGFVYERMKELYTDKRGDERERLLFLRDVLKGEYFFEGDERMSGVVHGASTDNILVHVVNEVRYPAIEKYKEILTGIADKVEFVDMNSITKKKTIASITADRQMERKVETFVRCADVDIKKFLYLDPAPREGTDAEDQDLRDLRAEMENVSPDSTLRLISYHGQNGRSVPLSSPNIDSVGTGKIISLAGYILDALKEGKTLIVDELDAGLHFRLTRAIVLLFDNRKNNDAQLMFTTHDVALLDLERLFRKDQIWFVDKDENGGFIYSMVDADGAGDRSNAEVFDRYRYGHLGAIPLPDFTPVLTDDEEDEGHEQE